MVGKHLNIIVFISWAAKMELEMSLYSKISASDSLSLQQEWGEGLPVQDHSCMGDGWIWPVGKAHKALETKNPHCPLRNLEQA